MKYTVVIRQPVPEAILVQLTQELSQQFELTTDQAAKLASRRNGRLMKPTSRKRAERLLQVFQVLGAQVTLEEVRDDTTLIRVPGTAYTGTGGVGIGGAGTTDSAGARYAENDSPSGSGHTAHPTPYGSGPLVTGESDLPAAGFTGAPGSGSEWRGSGWNTSGVATLPPVQTRPIQSSPSTPTHPAERGAFGQYTPHLDALLPTGPLESAPAFVQHDAEPITPEHVQNGVPEMNLGTLMSAGTAAVATTNVATTAVAATSTPEPISDDAWADFTGSLNSGAAAPTSEVSNANSIMTVDTSPDLVSSTRSSLSRRVLLSTLLPLGLFTLLTLGFLVYELPSAQRRLITENAQAVAVAVGSNLDVTDQNTVYAQLDALIKRSAVGFVQVNLPDGTTFFRSKNTSTDGALSERIAAWVQQHPDNSTFVQTGSAADSYRYQLSLLEQVGAGDSAQAKALRTSVADPANQASNTTTYLLSGINVTQNAQKDRVVGQGIKSGAGTPLYSIVVGVPGDAAFAQLRNLLLLVLGVALLAFIIASLLAARTARLVVRPIERLVRAADAISMGDLDRPVTVERNDEIGDLAQALERMRLSLEAAMERLRKRRKSV